MAPYEPGSTCQNRGCKEGLVGKAERQIWAQKGYGRLQENHWSEADECSHAEEVVGDDESKVGGEKEGGVDSVDLLSPGVSVVAKQLLRKWK
jgi:hypothetical protein